MMKKIDKAEDFALVFILSIETNVFDWYISQWATPYRVPLLFGTLMVIAPLVETYIESGRVIGIIAGQKSTAEYEILVGREGLGLAAVKSQNLAYMLIIAFMILGNIIILYKKVKRET